MERRDNYAITSAKARQLFLEYDAAELARKLRAKLDADYLYVTMLGEPYRIHRETGDVSRCRKGTWVEANSFAEVLTLMDLVCDSREDRYLARRWKNMTAFGLQFHENLLENKADPWAERFAAEPEAFAAACEALGGERFPRGDVAYAIEVFDGLQILVQLWFGDEDFPAQLRYMWDENATMYIRYETMHYFLGLLRTRLSEYMDGEKDA